MEMLDEINRLLVQRALMPRCTCRLTRCSIKLPHHCIRSGCG